MLYIVHVSVDHAIAQEWLEWMQDHHVPDVLQTDRFYRAWITRNGDKDTDQRAVFTMVYWARSRADFDDYQKHDAQRLRQEHIHRYAGRVEAERELWGIISTFEAEPLT